MTVSMNRKLSLLRVLVVSLYCAMTVWLSCILAVSDMQVLLIAILMMEEGTYYARLFVAYKVASPSLTLLTAKQDAS